MLIGPLLLSGCGREGCLDGAADCEVPSACPTLTFTCDGGSSELRVLQPGDVFPGGLDALAAPGDVLLGNDKVVAVIEALDHPHYLAPTGGGIVDLSTRGDDNDSLRHFFQVVGLLPGEAIHYDELKLLEQGDVKAIQLKGWLVGAPDVEVATRYEVRPCEPGLRIRTEIVNRTTDPLSWFLTDAWYFGGRENLPFTPGAGAGFNHPSFTLSTILTAFEDVPYLVAAAHVEPAAAYTEVSCDQDSLSGFHAEEISAVGFGPVIVEPRDYLVFERFVGVGKGAAVSAGADIALDVRKQLWGEPYTTLSGAVAAPGGVLGSEIRATVLIEEGGGSTPVAERIPWTEVLPAANGTFSARVPANRDYVMTVEAFGRQAGSGVVAVGGEPITAPTISSPAAGEVTLSASVDGRADQVVVYVVPADDATDAAVRGDLHGHFEECAPLLGNPHGASPACNRVLVGSGSTTVALPPGNYDFYASAGLFSTLAAQRGVTVDAETGQSISLEIRTIPVAPPGVLSADFHVHGGASFDSSFGDFDRVRAFLAARVDVIASTDHDVVHDYAEAMDALGANDRIHLITGTESTGHILFQLREDYGFPQVVGHWNFWPIPYDPEGPYRGAAWDELAEPGALMTRQRDAGWDDDVGIAQLNHPIGGGQFGRDECWGTAIGLDLNQPLPAAYDGSGQSLFLRTPEGAAFSNADYDVQEVMNGTSNAEFLGYRALWFYLLNHGIARAGTANSDSHSLTANVLGTPRNLVFTATTNFDAFDLGAFDEDVRSGHMIGTNGPVVIATVEGADGERHMPGMEPLEPLVPYAAALLHVEVFSAPWIPIDEVRIIVNGETKLVITEGLHNPTDPFAATGFTRFTTTIALGELVTGTKDAWIVVEVGHALEPNEDLDCNGIPDTGDNNRDGVVDWEDVEGLTEPPDEECFTTVGPLTEPPAPARGSADWYFRTVTPLSYPLAFTNPFLLDLDGNAGWGGGA